MPGLDNLIKPNVGVTSLIGDFARKPKFPKLFSSNCSVFFSSGDRSGKDGSKVTTVVATPGQGPDRPQEVSYTDTKVIGNGSFGVVYQAKLCETSELVAIKKVLQDKRFKVTSHTTQYTHVELICCFSF